MPNTCYLSDYYRQLSRYQKNKIYRWKKAIYNYLKRNGYSPSPMNVVAKTVSDLDLVWITKKPWHHNSFKIKGGYWQTALVPSEAKYFYDKLTSSGSGLRGFGRTEKPGHWYVVKAKYDPKMNAIRETRIKTFWGKNAADKALGYLIKHSNLPLYIYPGFVAEQYNPEMFIVKTNAYYNELRKVID